MSKIQVVYWTQSGNTQAMADAIGKGVTDAGKEAEVVYVGNADIEALKAAKGFALGCPAMGAEVLEESEFEPFFEALEGKLSGKKVALFGSYGWGDGEWMRNWEERVKNAGAELIDGEGLTAADFPDDDALEKCSLLGKTAAN